MGTAQFLTTITAMQGKVCFFETDVTVVVDYTIEDGEVDWRVDEFICADTAREWSEGLQRHVSVEHRCAVPEPIAAVFDRYLDRDDVEEKLHEHLRTEGELLYSGPTLRAEYHAGVM